MSARTDAFVQAVKEEMGNLPVTNPDLDQARGANAHMLATQHDSGKLFVLTGHDRSGRYFTKEARSFIGAYAMLTAVSGLERAWQVLGTTGRRRLVFERAAAF